MIAPGVWATSCCARDIGTDVGSLRAMDRGPPRWLPRVRRSLTEVEDRVARNYEEWGGRSPCEGRGYAVYEGPQYRDEQFDGVPTIRDGMPIIRDQGFYADHRDCGADAARSRREVEEDDSREMGRALTELSPSASLSSMGNTDAVAVRTWTRRQRQSAAVRPRC